MADYKCAARTNYFHVKDEEKFRKFASEIHSADNDFEFWDNTDENGKKMFAFGCCSRLIGVIHGADYTEDPNGAYDELITGLQDNVTEDDAVIIYEVGREKLRSLSGYAAVITSKACEELMLTEIAVEQARTMLNNKEWNTASIY